MARMGHGGCAPIHYPGAIRSAKRKGWNNPSNQPARIYVELRPGHAGFEQALRIGYGLATDGHTNAARIPKNLLHLALLTQMSDIKLVGPMAALIPLFGLLARIARRRGVEAELIARYGA